MKVSIIQNCHNGELYLKESLSSIINQSYTNFEVIFFDNNSNDQSDRIFHSFFDKRFKYFKSKKKLKLYEARNLAIQESNGELISFLDVDDWWDQNKLLKQVKEFKMNSKIDLVYSNYYIYNQLLKTKKKATKEILPSGKILNSLIENYQIGILTVLMRSEIFKKKKNLFDNNLTCLGDYDLFLRLSIDHNFYFMSECLAYYRNHICNYSNLNFTEELKEFNYFIKKKEIRKILNQEQIDFLKEKYNANQNKNLTLSKINNQIFDSLKRKKSIAKYLKIFFFLIKRLFIR